MPVVTKLAPPGIGRLRLKFDYLVVPKLRAKFYLLYYIILCPSPPSPTAIHPYTYKAGRGLFGPLAYSLASRLHPDPA